MSRNIRRIIISLVVLLLLVVPVYSQVTTTFTCTLGGGAHNWSTETWVKTGGVTNATYPGQTGYPGENPGDIHHVVILTSNPASRTIDLDLVSITSHVGDVSISNAPGIAVLNLGANSLTMSGNLSGAGTLQLTTGTLNIASNNNQTGTLTVGTGTINYNGSGAQSVRGVPYYNLTLSGSGTKTMAGVLTVNGNLLISGTANLYTNTFQITGNFIGTFTMGANTGLTLGNTGTATAVLFPTNFTTANTSLNLTSTVTYQSNINQAVSNVPAYGNLVIATNGTTKTCNGALTVNGNLTINGTSVFSAGTTAAVWNIAGNTTATGTLDFGTVTVKTISIGGDLSGAGIINMTGAGLAHILNLGGTNNAIGTFNTTAGSGSIVNYNRAGNQQVFASTNYRNLNIIGSGIKTISTAATLTVNTNLNITGSTLAYNSGAAHTVNITGNLSGTGTLDMSSGTWAHILNLNGATNAIGSLSTSSAASSVNYIRAGDQTLFGTPNYRNLTISGGGIKTLQDNATVNGTLTLTLGLLRIGNYDLTLANTTAIAGAPFGTSKMIETNGTGSLIRSSTANNNTFNLVYPVGSGSYYNPLIITGLPGDATVITRTLSVRTVPVNPMVLSNSINRYWDITATNITTTPAGVLSFTYNTGEISGDPLLFQPYTNASGTWALATVPSAPGSNPATSTGSPLISGRWTVGSANTYYSYQTGFWDQASTWTFDPGGTTGPGTTIPGINDKVVVLSGRTVTLQADVFTQYLDVTLNNGGILDLSTHSMASTLSALRGSGILRLSSSDFPVVLNNTFVTTDGGTTEYNHSGSMSPVQSTYYNLTINSSGTVIMTNNNTLNGNLYVKQGTFQINDATIRRLQLVINGNVTIDNTASLTIGTGRTNTQAGPLPSITGSTNPPFLDYYELQSHRIQIYSDFTNNGIAKFTNLTYPVYNSFPVNGFATVYFNGSANNTIICNGQTDFYNLVVDKGSDQTFNLTVQSSAYANFRLFGANTSDGSTTLPPATSANPNLKKALWIKNGTMILEGLVVIPSLSEGATAGSIPSDFFIPANGALVLDGPGAIVLSTADDYTEINAAYGLAGGSNVLYGINTTGGYSGISVLGKLQINDGYLSTRESSGLMYWSYASGQIILNGGIVDTKQLHNPQGGANGLVTWVQAAGDISIRGRFTNDITNYNNPADLASPAINTARAANGTDATAGIGAFSINSNTSNGFAMAGGTIDILDVCNTSATPLAFLVNCPASNINVTGGTVSLKPTTGTLLADADFMVNTTGPLYNLNINRASGLRLVQLNTYPIVILNNLNIIAGNLTANNLNVTVGGDFSISSGTAYSAGTNTTLFNGTATQDFTVNIAAPLILYKLSIEKPSGSALNLAGTQSTVNVTSDFRLALGTLNDNGKTVNVAGNIYNSGIHNGTGKIVLNGTAAAQSIDGNGIFRNIELNNTFGGAGFSSISLLNNTTVKGTLTFSQNRLFNINTYNLKLDSAASVAGSNSARYFKSAGNAGDGGVTKVFTSSTTFSFPVGVINYTPASLTINGTPASYGSITVIPVNYEHPNVTASGRSLTYFWRTKSTGFDLAGGSVTHGYTYADANVVVGGDVTEAGYVAARFYVPTSSWTKGTIDDVNEALNIAGEPGIGSFLENVNFIDGDYTAGDDDATNPFGVPTTYYSRQSGLWSDNNTWSLSGHAGAAAGSAPVASDIVIIGGQDSVYLSSEVPPFPVNDANPPATYYQLNKALVNSASLQIEVGSVLDIQNNPGCDFGLVNSHPNGNGKLRLTTRHPANFDATYVYAFPNGDFSEFNVNEGTTEFYTINPQAGTLYILPPLVTSYGNVILTPLRGSNLILPNNNYTTIYGDIVCNGSDADAWLAMTWWDGAYGAIVPKTVYVKKDFIVQGGSFVFIDNGATAQNIIVDGDVIVYPGAAIHVWQWASTSTNNSISIGGDLINNSDNSVAPYGTQSMIRLYWGATRRCNLAFFGSTSSSLTNNTGISASPTTILYNVTVNKGSSQATSLTIDITGTLTTLTDNWLTLQNGTLRYMRNNPNSDFTISTGTPFSIPSTSGLYVDLPSNTGNRNILISNSSTNTGDLFLNGKLTLINGNVYVGPVATTAFNNDIEYSVGGSSTIDVQGGTLVVNGQIRRNPSSAGGILKYSQTGGTVTVRGQAANTTNAKLEVLNTGSEFTMSGGSLNIVQGNGSTTTPSSPLGDLYLRPENGSVTGGTIIFSQGGLAAPQNYFLDANIALRNLTITGTSAANYATVRLLTSPLTLNGDLTISANSTLNANNINTTFNGNFINTPGSTGYVAGTNLTTFSASNGSSYAGAQSITGITNFYDLSVSPGTSLTLNNSITVNNNLSINSGSLIITGNSVSLKGNVVNNASYTDNNTVGSGLILNGTLQQQISGSGSFARLTLNNAAGARIENNITLQEDLTLTQGILDIKKYLLTLGVNSNIQGGPFSASKMVTTDGVFSNVGIRKFFNSGPSPFEYPIGTAGKYTPVQLNINTNNTVGYVRVNNINSRHPAVLDPANTLDYYWEVQSSGVSGLTGNIVFNYMESDVVGDELNYKTARLVIPGSTCDISSGVDNALNTITYLYNPATNNLSGEYTAGITSAFFTNVPVYTTNSDGNWTDQTIWDNTGGDPYPCPVGGPNGFIVIINHSVTLDANYCQAYRTTINGTLRVVPPFSGHNLGTVYGTGTLYLESGTFPAGVYTTFMDCSNHSTLEYGGLGNYTFIADLFNRIPNLVVSGTGTRVLPNLDLTICDTLTINGPVLDNSVYNKKLIIQGGMKHLAGTFTSGTGSGAVVSFAGSSPQLIGGSLGNFTGTSAFNHFEINNSAGLTIKNSGAIEIKGNLLLTNGLINTGTGRILTITNTAINSVTPSGGSGTSFIDGPLTKKISQYDNFVFPVGIDKSGSYVLGNKLRISSTQTGPALWTAQYKNPNPTSTLFTAPLQGVSSMEYFTIESTAGSMAIVNINWTPTSDVNPVIAGGIANIRIANYNTGTTSWVEVATSSSGNDNYGTASTTGLVTYTGSDDYTLGSVTPLIPRAQFTPSGPVCGNDGIPVTFTAPTPIPFDYVINYTIDGAAQAPVTITSLDVPYTLPTLIPGAYKLTGFTYDNGAETGVVDATVVNVYPDPTVAYAGLDQTLCGITTTNLDADPAVVGVGMWSIVSGTGGTVITPSDSLSQFIGLNGYSYTLRWTISSGTCTSTDDVIINFTILPDPPAATTPQEFCPGAVVSDLVATPPVGCTVEWYDLSAGGVLLPGGTILSDGTIYYAESNGGGGCLSLSRTAVSVQVDDSELPVILCPGDLTAECDIFEQPAYVSYAEFTAAGGSATDNCGIDPVSFIMASEISDGATCPETVTRTYQISDINGNINTCTQDIVIDDDTDPTASNPLPVSVQCIGDVPAADITVVTDEADNCTAAPVVAWEGDVNNGGPGCSGDPYIVTRTYSVTDDCGNTINVTQTITAIDTTDPSIDTPSGDQTVECDGAGNIAAFNAWLTGNGGAAASDVCNSVSWSNDYVITNWVTDCGNAQHVTVVFTATDDCGNDATTSATFTIEDTTDPSINNCPSDITVSNDPGNCSASVTWIAPTATDNCGLASFISSHNSGDVFPVGITTVTYTATDDCGNTSTCAFNVTVNDTENPAITFPADININNGTGLCGAIVNYVAPVGTDNCPGAVTTQIAGLVSGALFPVGTTVNTFQVTDASGNINTCSFNVIVTDTELPEIVCPGNISVTGVCSTVVTYVTPVGTDNCPGAVTIQTAGLPSGSTFPVGITTNSFLVTDAAGLTATCSFTVEVIDDILPVINCPADIIVNNDPGTCDAVVTYVAPVGTDNCPGAITAQIAGLASGSTFPLGTTVNTFEVTDAYGNTAQCSFNVIVNDNEVPAISCPADIDVNNDPGICGAVVNYVAPVGTDNCPGALTARTQGLSSGSVFPVGINTVEYTVIDASGNSASCSFTVTVYDNEDPAPDDDPLPDITDECEVTTLTPPTATDNCTGTIAGTHNATLPITSQGTTIVTWTYDDGNGNIITQPQNVIIDDVTDPLPDVDPLPDITGECSATITVVPTATDNCTGTVTGTTLDPLTYSSQGTYTVTWTYDDGNGNTSAQIQTVMVDDVTAPVPDVPALPDVTGECTATIAATPTATDNCSGAISGTTGDPLTYSSQGTYIVTWSYDDGNGNISAQTQNVVIDDVTAPVPDVPALPDVTGECTATITVTPTATDKCSGTITGTTTDPLTYSTEGTHTVTWSYDDGNGNISTQTQNVVIDDITVPVPDLAVLPDVTDECSVAALTSPTATDNCGGVVTVTHDAILPITAQGTTVVTWTYDDGNGNTTTQTQNVVINDITEPVPDIDPLPDVTDECSVAALTSPTATDNCGGVVTVTHDATLPITAQGTTVVTWTYDDGNGNTTIQTQNIVIDDVTPPVPDVDPLPDVTDECSVAALTSPTATDNCGGVVTVTHDATLPITAQGTTVVTWTYDDGNGNTSTQTQNVIITDVTPPVPDVDPLSDVTAECEVTTLTAPTATDNCVGTVTGTHTATLPITTTTVVTWTYDDGNGNTSTQNQNVVINDITAPVPDINPLPDVTVECEVTTLTAPTATDNCTGTVTGTHTATLPITAQDTTVITWTYDDGNGNTSTQTQYVILTDVTAPVPDIDPLPDITDECSVAALTSPTATDNCGGVVTVTHDATLPITAQGTTVVTWTYDDGNSNTITQTQNVIITDASSPVPDIDPLPDVTAECEVTTLTAPTATDNCAGVITGTHDATLPITTQGTTIVTWTYDDGYGNTTTQTQNVILSDTELPVITCSSDISQYEDAGFNYATVIVPDAVISDNCSVSTLTWTMTGVTVDTSPATGINQVGIYIFDTGITTVSYEVSDEAGNTEVCSFDIIVSPPPPLTGTIVSQTNVACFGESTGSVTVSGSGGIEPYEYSIDGTNYQSSDTFSSLSAGSYTVTVRDAEMTTYDIPVSTTEPASALAVATTQTDNICFNGTSGTATATAAGGTTPYDYSWDTTPVQTTATATGLAAGTYTVTVTDANGCTNYANVTISEPSEITISISQVNVLCNGGADGTATASAVGGSGSYTYSWDTSPVQTNATATGLVAGTYTVTATDVNGCTNTETVQITEPTALSLDATPTNSSCPDTEDGEIALAITGGTSPYGLIWSDGITTRNRTSLPPGTYSVVVTDANGCAESLSIDVGYNISFNCLVIPDIITPNHDGHNDEWIIKNIDMYPDAEVRVFNRWGRLIYRERNIMSNPWDGTFKGKLVPTDSYHYILDLNDGSQLRSGVISVIREN